MKVNKGFPSQNQLNDFWKKIQSSSYSYKEVGASKGEMPKNFDQDRNQILIGRGTDTFDKAKNAITNWEMFPSSWTYIHPKAPIINEGESVVVLFQLFGLWWFNACRIVYTINSSHHFGFAYGTLQEHTERGEERFEVYIDDKECVWYRIIAFSRPRVWYARFAYPVARYYQRRFVRHSLSIIKKSGNTSE